MATSKDIQRKDDENQKYILLIHHDSWGSEYKSIGPFSSYEAAVKWRDDHRPENPKDFLLKLVPITMPWKSGRIV